MTTTAPQVVPTSTAGPSGARPRVLIADDSRVIRQAIKKILDGEFDVELADSGDTALNLLSSGQMFQMLVTDIEMPGMDGYELICRIRGSEQAPLKDIPILTITGAEDEQTRERAFACGATDFITKPIDATQLKARVQSYVRLDRSVRDMTEKVAALEDQAIADPVTGLRSRRYFLQRGEQDFAYCQRNGKDITVIRFDIDRYKEIYRKHGDEAGDGILVWLAGLVSANARVEDTVARVAGAKFSILAAATDIEAAKSLCLRVRKAIQARPFTHANVVIRLTLSFGLASVAQDRASRIEALLDLAEERVARAAAEGGDRVCISVLGDTAPRIEEVVLDVGTSTDETSPDIPVTRPNSPSSQSAPAISAPPDSPPPTDPVIQLLSVDRALQLIRSGQASVIEPYLDALMEQLRPLLELIARADKPGTKFSIKR